MKRNKSIVNTLHDGWDCSSKIKDLPELVDEINYLSYEIKNCVRTSSVLDIVDAYMQLAENLLEACEDINTNEHFKTIEDEN